MNPLLVAESLRIRIPLGRESFATILDGISFELFPGETLAIVGEPGCGKSTLAKACAGLLAPSNLRFQGKPLLRSDLGKGIALLDSQVALSLDPFQTIGEFAQTILHYHYPTWEPERIRATLSEKWSALGDETEPVLDKFPRDIHISQQLRAIFSIVAALGPQVLVAESITLALAEEQRVLCLQLVQKLLASGNCGAVLWLSGNFMELTNFADRIHVLYAGEFVESGNREQILQDPRHPFTRMLRAQTLPNSHSGGSPDLRNPPTGCRFAFRCPVAGPECAHAKQLVRTVADRDVKCMYAQ